ncbi:MAG: FAD-binding oxidoreductase [Solirubrobacterales bacterium]
MSTTEGPEASTEGRERRWWGWGDGRHEVSLGPGARAMLAQRLGATEPWPVPALADLSMPEAGPLPPEVLQAAGPDAVRTDDAARLRCGHGQGYPDLAQLRQGVVPALPDAVVRPPTPAAVAAVLRACTATAVAVVPFGGGTSVVGGVDPVRGSFETVIALDLGALTNVQIDPVSMTARLGAGLAGPDAERAVGAHGFTIGHLPQSFEHATVGGWAATRSAGQASSRYGRFDALVREVTLAAPVGGVRTLPAHSAAGPSVRELILGSEGVLGVITDVVAQIRRVPERRVYEAWMAADLAAGTATVRELAQDDALPDVVRLSDEQETEMSLALADTLDWQRSLLERYLRLRGREGGCLMICGWEGTAEGVARERARAGRRLRAGGAVSLGTRMGRVWEQGRFHGPYLRDVLLDEGLMVETLETAHTWAGLADLYGSVHGAIARALDDQGTPGIVLCHLSHAYRDGASLYFTFLAPRRPGAELEQWRAVKRAAGDAISAAGATITHHHAVGQDHAPWMRDEIGSLALDGLRALKAQFDPAGIMNPGKLLSGELR